MDGSNDMRMTKSHESVSVSISRSTATKALADQMFVVSQNNTHRTNRRVSYTTRGNENKGLQQTPTAKSNTHRSKNLSNHKPPCKNISKPNSHAPTH